MTLRVAFFSGEAMRPYLAALAELRIAVFREWPYLYDGELSYERTYLSAFARSAGAGLAVAFDGDTPVGCSSCLPLADEDAQVSAPLRARAWDVGQFFYFGESVLLAQYRGQGIGVAFFREREAHARATPETEYACFCAVQRPADHPRQPPDAVPLDGFWRRRGYTLYPGLTCTMRWKQVDSGQTETNALAFWIKPLRGAKLP